MSVLVSLGLAFAVTWFATRACARLAARKGLVDRPDSPRKAQARAVPTVGVAGILLGLAAASLAVDSEARAELFGGGLGLPAWAGLAALVLAFAVGTLDDLVRGGLRPTTKLALQFVACAPLAAAFLRDGQPVFAVAALAFGVAALNIGNTFDNADGAFGALALLGLAIPAPVAAAAVAGFLPANLDGRLRARAGTPSAYLGDAGSHLLAMLLFLHPLAWPVLLLPAADLARLSVVRTRAGSRPWIGDRRHLAHRLQARGLTPLGVVLCLIAIAAPSSLAGLGGLPVVLFGPAATLALFALALWRAPEGRPQGSA